MKIEYKDADTIICLWLKSIFLLPIWGMFLAALMGLLGCLTDLFHYFYFAVIIGGLVYFWHDYKKLHLELKENVLCVGLKKIDLNDLKLLYVQERQSNLATLPRDLNLVFSNDRRVTLSLYRLSTKNLETLINYIRSHVPNCKINRTVESYLRDSKINDYTVKVRVFKSSMIAQLFEALKNLKIWWSEKALLLILVVCFPLWTQVVFGIMCILPVSFRMVQSIQNWHEPIRLFGYVFTFILTLTGNGVQAMHENPVLMWGCFLFVAVSLVGVFRDLIFWRVCTVTHDYFVLSRDSLWGTVRSLKYLWKHVSAIKLDQDILSFCASNQTFTVNLKNVNPIERANLLQTIYKFAPKEAFSIEDQEAFQPNQKFSYTELWLQSLSGSPQQDSLVPLQKDSSLKDGLYKVIDVLGAGGQGTAYLCITLGSSQKVVLKETIFPVYVDKSIKRSSIDRFEKEATVLKSLEHQSIVSLIEAFIEDHRGYMVLEHIDGKNLRILRKKDSFEVDKLKDLLLQMCDVLEFLHEKGYTHRDFTPENLILDKDKTLKLIDFAVAQKITDGITATVVGKHSYISPEQFRGRACPQSDIYSLGATIYFLITGRDPEPISKLKLEEDDPLHGTVYDTIIQNCTELDLKSRYPSIQRIKSDLLEETQSVILQKTKKEKEEVWRS